MLSSFFLIPHGSNLLPCSLDVVETQTELHYRDFKVPSSVPEMSSSAPKLPGSFGGNVATSADSTDSHVFIFLILTMLQSVDTKLLKKTTLSTGK